MFTAAATAAAAAAAGAGLQKCYSVR